MGKFTDLIVYQKAYRLALDIHLVTQKFPSEEKFGMISQIRRSSKSVCANFAESYRRRKYRRHFLSKLSDCLSENSETGVWLDFSKDLKFLSEEDYIDLRTRNEEVGRMLAFMVQYPEKFI
ncbi:MAG: four helix bundle protein [Chitinophagaceae bacterium]|nr:MAG: four helix bundle protein [Chitinophagaceae bacterium]